MSFILNAVTDSDFATTIFSDIIDHINASCYGTEDLRISIRIEEVEPDGDGDTAHTAERPDSAPDTTVRPFGAFD
jgi:hypothetical protein